MSEYVATRPVDRPARNRYIVGCWFWVVVAVVVLLIAALLIQRYSGHGKKDDAGLPAWVQHGIERMECQTNERVAVIRLDGGAWRVDCIGG